MATKPELGGIPITVTEPLYRGESGDVRDPTMLENRIQYLLTIRQGAVERSIDPDSGERIESLAGLRNGHGLGSSMYAIERRVDPKGQLNQIVCYGLNGIDLSRGPIWSDSQGEIWQSVGTKDQSRYPKVKWPLLAARLKKLTQA